MHKPYRYVDCMQIKGYFLTTEVVIILADVSAQPTGSCYSEGREMG
jgi:hypothetical protein